MMELNKVLWVTALGLGVVGCGGQEAETWAEGADAVAATAERQDALTSNHTISHWCTGGGQVCSPRWTICQDASTSGTAYATFTASPQHCSSIYMRFYVDGAYKTVSGLLAPGVGTGRLSLGTVSPGCHEFALEAVGTLTGCNTGTLTGWSGTLKLETP